MRHLTLSISTANGNKKACIYPVFRTVNGRSVEVALLIIYQSGEIEYEKKQCSIKEIAELVRAGSIRTSIKNGERIVIPELTTFKVESVLPVVTESEFLKEIEDIQRELNGVPTTSDECREAYYRCLKSPTQANRQFLKEAYEKIPRHLDVWILAFPEKPSQIEQLIGDL